MKLEPALASYKRDNGFLPEMRLRNLMLEKTPADDEGIVLLPRPGLKTSYSVGSSPVAAIFAQPNVFGGNTITLSGTAVYNNTVNIGALSAAADRNARFAAISGQLVFCSGGALYRYDGTTLTTPALPNNINVSSVAVLNNYFLAAMSGAQQFYWSQIGDATSWPALNFAQAESHPDQLLDIIVLNDHLALIGQESIEFWQPNPAGDANLPFSRIDGLTLAKGAFATGSSLYIDNTLVWVGNDGIIYRRGAVPTRISDHGVEEQIAKSATARLFAFVWIGHTVLVLSLDKETLFYDFETQEWCEASSVGFTGWRAQCSTFDGITPLFGDSLTGLVMKLDEATLIDVDASIERRFTAMIPSGVTIKNLRLDAQGGIGSEPNGSPIIVELSISRDGSQQFGPFLPSDLGKRGEYRKRALWRRLGRFDMGAVLDFRITDTAAFEIQSIVVNESLSGRGS